VSDGVARKGMPTGGIIAPAGRATDGPARDAMKDVISRADLLMAGPVKATRLPRGLAAAAVPVVR